MHKKLNTKDLYKFTINYFEKTMPVAETELHYQNPYELTVAVILSAQCTDKRVNMTTPAFFRSFPTVESLATATVEDIFSHIRNISYPNNKAKNLKGMSQSIINNFNGQLPDNVDRLQEIPGIGRKTANVLASVLFDKPVIAVDTHVFRVSARIGLTQKAKTPLECEKQLSDNIPNDLRPKAHHWLILHGRYVCTARKPKCNECGLSSVCKFFLENK